MRTTRKPRKRGTQRANASAPLWTLSPTSAMNIERPPVGESAFIPGLSWAKQQAAGERGDHSGRRPGTKTVCGLVSPRSTGFEERLFFLGVPRLDCSASRELGVHFGSQQEGDVR